MLMYSIVNEARVKVLVHISVRNASSVCVHAKSEHDTQQAQSKIVSRALGNR